MAEVVCDIQRIPLDRLAASPENARRAPPGDAAHAELKASLAAHGLLENLVVRAVEAAPDGAARYAVVAGGRRLAALRELARAAQREANLRSHRPLPRQPLSSPQFVDAL